jgi:hypothetical protein
VTTTRLGWQAAREEQRAPILPAREAAWPDAVAYREVIQNPGLALNDPRLRESSVALDRRGLPLAYTGRFAVVFRLTPRDGSTWAVRCFTTAPGEGGDARHARYALLEPRLAAPEIADLFVPFAYLPSGVRVSGREYPALAMQWAEGETLGRFVERNRENPEALLTLAATLGDALERLRAAGIAHGDWQHDNLLVSEDGRHVTFVDYDGVFVSELADYPPGEKGHPNYQHPARTEGDYGPDLDRFPCLLMQTALVALAHEPSLWDSYSDGESLLFGQMDLAEPAASVTFATLRLVAERSPELAGMLKTLDAACRKGTHPDAADRATLEKAAKGLGLTLRGPEKTGRRRGPIAKGATVAAQTATPPRETVALSAATKQWLDGLRTSMNRQQAAERLHMAFMRLFYGGVVASNFTTIPGFADGTWPLACALLVVPLGTAFGLYFWPRNLDGLRLIEAVEQNKEKITVNGEEWDDARRHLFGINNNPAHLSAIAFVAAALQAHRLDTPEVRKEIGLTRAELLALGRAGVTRLSDLNTDLSFALDEPKQERLLALKQRVMNTAQTGYQNLSEKRRELQREIDRLETERQGLIGVESELNQRSRQLGEATFSRFLMRLLGL